MDMVLAKSDIGIASRYKELVEDAAIARSDLRAPARANGRARSQALLAILDQQRAAGAQPALARTIRNRFPYIDPLNHVQLELLKRHRAGDTDERVVAGHPPHHQRHRRRLAEYGVGAVMPAKAGIQ